jgi:hypothetical protein
MKWGAREECRWSAGTIVWKMKKYYIQSQGGKEYPTNNKEKEG